MAGNASDYLEVELRKHIFRTGSFTKPTALYVSLHTANPLDAGSGAEVTGGTYARVDLPPLDANWSAPDATGGLTKNSVAIVFPAPVGADYGVVTHFAVWDAATVGNMLVHGVLDNPRTILDGDPAPRFPIDTLSVTFS